MVTSGAQGTRPYTARQAMPGTSDLKGWETKSVIRPLSIGLQRLAAWVNIGFLGIVCIVLPAVMPKQLS